MANEDIRTAIKEADMKHWMLSDLLNISEATLVRKLRHELSTKEKAKILSIINKNINEKKEGK